MESTERTTNESGGKTRNGSTDRSTNESAGSGERTGIIAVLDYVCPYCYLAESMLARLRDDDGVAVEIDYRAFELRPAPAPLLDPDDPELEREWTEDVEPLARSLGVEIRRPSARPRSRKAHEATAYARSVGRFDAMHAALYRAYFVEGRDIGRVDVLLDVGERVGIERSALKVELDIDRHVERVIAEQEAVVGAGIDAVPAFVIGRETLVGLPAYEDLRRRARGESSPGV